MKDFNKFKKDIVKEDLSRIKGGGIDSGYETERTSCTYSYIAGSYTDEKSTGDWVSTC